MKFGLLSKIGWPPGSQKKNDKENSEGVPETQSETENVQSTQENKKKTEKLYLKNAVQEFKETVIGYKIQTGRDLSEGEQRKLATEILLKHVQKNLSETRLDSGFLTRNYEKSVQLWEKMPKLVQFMISQSLTSAISLYTGAGIGITSKDGLARRLGMRVGINVLLKGVFENITEEAVTRNPEANLKQRVINVFQRMAKTSTTGAIPFDKNSVSVTFKENKTNPENTANITPTPNFSSEGNPTMNQAEITQGLNTSDNENNTGLPRLGRSVSATGDMTLKDTLESSTQGIEQAQEERYKMLKELLTFKNLLLVGSVGPVFYMSGSIVGLTALSGIALKEAYAYILKQKTKMEEKKVKSQQLTSKISLFPTLNEGSLDIEPDAKVLLKEFKALVPEMEKIATNLKMLKNWKEGGDMLISIMSDLGTETAYHAQDITIDPQAEVFRHLPKAIKRFAKVGGIVEKAVTKTKAERLKEIRNAPKEELNELKFARTEELDEIEYEIYKVKQEIKDLKPKSKKDKEGDVIAKQLEKINTIKEKIKSPTLEGADKKSLEKELNILEKISEAEYLVSSNEEKKIPETMDGVITTPENTEKIKMLEAGRIVLEEIKQEIKDELSEIKKARNTLAKLNMTPREVKEFDEKQKKIEELKESENLVYMKNMSDCLNDLRAVYQKLETAKDDTLPKLEENKIKLEKELVFLVNSFNKIQDERYALEGRTREQVLADEKRKELKKKRMKLRLEQERAAKTQTPDKDDTGNQSISVKLNTNTDEEEYEEELSKAA